MQPTRLIVDNLPEDEQPLPAREKNPGGNTDCVDAVVQRAYDSEERAPTVNYSEIGIDYPVKGTFIMGGTTAKGGHNNRKEALLSALERYGGYAMLTWKDGVPTVVKPGVLWPTVVSDDIDARIWAVRVCTQASLDLANGQG